MEKRYLRLFFILLFLSVIIVNGCNKNTTDQSSTSPQVTKEETKSKNTINEVTSVIVDGLLIGGYYQGKWAQTEDIVSKIKGGETYRMYSSYEYYGNVKGKKPTIEDEIGQGYYIDFDVKSETGSPNQTEQGNEEEFSSFAIGTNSELDFEPLIKKNRTFYEDIMSKYLKKKGLTNYKINLTQGVSVDLDNDKKKEHLVSSGHYNLTDTLGDGWYKAENNYSLLVLSRDNLDITAVKEAVLQKAGEMSEFLKVDQNTDMVFRSHYYIVGVIDINNDGKKEIISREEIQGGILYSIFQYENGTFQELLTTGIGS
ncbi:MAG: hypothetical protein M0Z31_09415 [Clostridia bacterium]|nr:hypothetical protein [Clostridia bacterium]